MTNGSAIKLILEALAIEDQQTLTRLRIHRPAINQVKAPQLHECVSLLLDRGQIVVEQLKQKKTVNVYSRVKAPIHETNLSMQSM